MIHSIKTNPNGGLFKVRTLPLLSFCLLLLNLFALPLNASDDGATTFNQKCTGCHTIGKGQLVGPDLQVVKSWTDDKLTAAVKRMQQQVGPLNEQEISGLVSFLKSSQGAEDTAGGKSTGSAPEPGSSDKTAQHQQPPGTSAPAGEKKIEAVGSPGATGDKTATAVPDAIDIATMPGSVEAGRRLFNGEQALANAGISCISCHQAEGNGGTMGPDLSGIANKLPPAALVASCQTTPFKVMKDVYAKHPVTRQEAIDLTKYFESLKGKAKPVDSVPAGWLGLGGAVLLMAIIGWSYRNRKQSARDKLHRR